MKYVFAALAFVVVIVYSAIGLDLLYSVNFIGYYTGEALRYCFGTEMTAGDWSEIQMGFDMFALYTIGILLGLIVYIMGDGGNGRKVLTVAALFIIAVGLLVTITLHSLAFSRVYENFWWHTMLPPMFVAVTALAVYLVYKELRDK
jgi:hypothetical protein